MSESCKHSFSSDNRCIHCKVIGYLDTDGIVDGNRPSLPVGGRCITQRSTSRMLPDENGHRLNYPGDLVCGWIHLNRDIYTDGKFWVRFAFADATWKTYERDWMKLSQDEANQIFESLSGYLGRLAFAPSLKTLFEMGWGFG